MDIQRNPLSYSSSALQIDCPTWCSDSPGLKLSIHYRSPGILLGVGRGDKGIQSLYNPHIIYMYIQIFLYIEII